MVVPRVLLLMVVWHSCLCLPPPPPPPPPPPQEQPQQEQPQVKRFGDFVEDQVDFVQDVAEDALKLANQVSGPELGVGLFDLPPGGAPPPPPPLTPDPFGSPSFQGGPDPSPQGGLFDPVVDLVQSQGSQLADSVGAFGSSVQSQLDFAQDQASQLGDTLHSTLDSFGSSVQSHLDPAVDLVQDQGNQFIDSLQGTADSFGKTVLQPSYSPPVNQHNEQPDVIGGLIKGGFDALSKLNPFAASSSHGGGSPALFQTSDQPRLGLGVANPDGVRDIVTGGLKLVGLDKILGPILQGLSDIGETAGRVVGTTVDGVRKVAHQAGETTAEVVGGPVRSFKDTKNSLGELKVELLRNARTTLEALGEVARDKLRSAGDLAMAASIDAAVAALGAADALGKFANKAATNIFFTARDIGQTKLERAYQGIESVVKLGSTVGEALEDTVSAFLPTEDPSYGDFFMQRAGDPKSETALKPSPLQ